MARTIRIEHALSISTSYDRHEAGKRNIVFKENDEVVAAIPYSYDFAKRVVQHVSQDNELGYLLAYNQTFALHLTQTVSSFGDLLNKS